MLHVHFSVVPYGSWKMPTIIPGKSLDFIPDFRNPGMAMYDDLFKLLSFLTILYLHS